MTASDTPEPWPNPLSDKLVAWRQRADMGSSFPPDIVLVLLDALTAARARIEELALINANLGIEHDKLRDLMEARGARIEQLEGALRDLRQGCIVWAHDEDGVHNLCADAYNAASRLLGLRELVPDERYGTLVPAQPPAVAPEAESGPPILPHNPEHEATVDALVARRTTERRAESGPPWPCMCGMSINTGPRCSMCGSERDADSSEGQPTPEPEDRSEPPEGYEVQEHSSDLGDDGPPCTTYVAFAPMYAYDEGDDETRAAAVARCIAHRDRILAPERKLREAAERERDEMRKARDAANMRARFLAEDNGQGRIEAQQEDIAELTEKLAAAERERDSWHEKAQLAEHETEYQAHRARTAERDAEELKDSISIGQFAILRGQLAAAERRASEAEKRADSSYDQGRAAAFAETLQELQRHGSHLGTVGLRAWLDRKRSIAEGKAEG